MKKSKRTISKKKYIRKTKHNRRTKRIAGGNILEEIDLRQILITTPIINAVKEYNTDIDMSQFKLSKSAQGFKLSRMEQMMLSNFDKLLESDPVELKVAKNSDGKMIGTKIDGIMKKMYEIINGRHRITRSIIEGHKTIKSNILYQ
jgi:hypothetical protein